MAFKPARLAPLTGNWMIDRDHERLLEILTDCREVARMGDVGAFLRHSGEFRQVLEAHFENEEVVLRGAQFERLEEHSAKHRSLVADIGAVVAEVGGERRAAPTMFAALDVLEDALFDHELIDDSGYLDHVRPLRGRAIAWGAEFAVGVAWVDEQHRALIEMLNDIDSATAQGVPAEPRLRAVEHFDKCISRHFVDEEAQLAEWGVDVADHQRHHGRARAGLDEILAALRREASDLQVQYLVFWLVDHIQKADMIDFRKFSEVGGTAVRSGPGRALPVA